MSAPARTTHPRRVGRYRLLAPIARGGAATVYLGLSESIGGFSRVVAVKMLHVHLLDDSTSHAAQEFIEEAKLSARIRHPMIVPVIDVGQSEDGFFLVMDYVDGASLSEILKLSKIPVRIAARILDDVLQGLHSAHVATDEQGKPLRIVHRDYSPQNILVGTDGRSRLTDFGIARATTRAEYTRTGLVKGKIAYMSPEQGKGQALDARADVWAAGVVAWEMLAGRRMYPGMEPMPMLLQVTTKRPPRLKVANPEVSLDLEEAVHSALEMDPERRCASAIELRDRIMAALGGKSQMATDEEVGEFVRQLHIERLDQLRAIVKEALENPSDESSEISQVAAARPHAEQPTVADPPRRAQTLPDQSGTFATSTSDSQAVPPSQGLRRAIASRPRAVSIAAAVAAMGAVVAWFSLGNTDPAVEQAALAVTPPRTDGAQQGGMTKGAVVGPNAVGSAAVTPSSGASPAAAVAPVREELEVIADRPVRELSVGSRVILLASPRKVVSVRLLESERNKALTLSAVSDDLRQTQGTVKSSETKISLTFPKTAPRARPGAKASGTRPSKPGPNTDLAASPYK